MKRKATPRKKSTGNLPIASVPTRDDPQKAHNKARHEAVDGVEIIAHRFGEEASYYYEALALTPADTIVLCSCDCEKWGRQPLSAYESVLWMAHEKWAERFDADTSVHDEATSRWLMIVARAMEQKGACVSLRKSRTGVYMVTLNPKLSKLWDTASERTGIPLDWLLYDELRGGAEYYLEEGTGYAEDTRPVWWAQRKAKVPIQIVKA